VPSKARRLFLTRTLSPTLNLSCTPEAVKSQIDLDVCGEAVDGVDAIEKARALKPDLVVIDLAMPRMNGVEATSELRAMMPRVPIVVFAMYDDAVGRALALSAGANLVVSKPSGG
jgi:DNA-binding NarL/FixJ family response regulator